MTCILLILVSFSRSPGHRSVPKSFLHIVMQFSIGQCSFLVEVKIASTDVFAIIISFPRSYGYIMRAPIKVILNLRFFGDCFEVKSSFGIYSSAKLRDRYWAGKKKRKRKRSFLEKWQTFGQIAATFCQSLTNSKGKFVRFHW